MWCWIIAAAVGAIYVSVAVDAWVLYAAISPVQAWLDSSLSDSGATPLIEMADRMHDTLVNMLIALPFAAVFVFVEQLRFAKLLLFAAFFGAIFSLMGSWLGLGEQDSLLLIVFVAAMPVVILPLPYVLLREFHSACQQQKPQ